MDAWLRAVRWEAGKLRDKIFSANFVEPIQALVARRLKMSEAQLQRKVLQAWLAEQRAANDAAQQLRSEQLATKLRWAFSRAQSSLSSGLRRGFQALQCQAGLKLLASVHEAEAQQMLRGCLKTWPGTPFTSCCLCIRHSVHSIRIISNLFLLFIKYYYRLY